MLLDIKEPTRVLARTKQPILEPLEVYENDGLKEGVVYPCGAVIIQDRLFVYYGGADMVTCVATANINAFLASLRRESEAVEISYPVHSAEGVTFTKKEKVTGYCLKCRKRIVMKTPRHFITKNLRRAIAGFCPKCGTKMIRFG